MIHPLDILLFAVCVVLGWKLWDKRRHQAQEKSANQELRDLVAELRGRYEALAATHQTQMQASEQEREKYRDLATRWHERISSIDTSLTKLSNEATQKVSDMAGMLKPIVSIFRSPQAAGIEFGEAQLEMLLKTRLGEGLYIRKPQMLAQGQDVVDFAIKLPDCLVPIDSKFPSAQYKAWVEAANDTDQRATWRAFRDQMVRQIQTTAKYIKPDAGTTDYALVFVPNDIIYQHAFLAQNVYDQENPIPQKCQELQVFGCSPLTLMPIFSLIRLGLRNLRIAEDVKGIRSQIDELNTVFQAFLGTDWKILRGHLKQLIDHVEKLSGDKGSVNRLGDTIKKLTDLSQERPSIPAGPDELLAIPREVS